MRTSTHHDHLLGLCRTLQTMRKGNMSMDDYLHWAKQLTDSLATFGQPMAETDLQQMILIALDIAYHDAAYHDVILTSLTSTLIDTSLENSKFFWLQKILFHVRTLPSQLAFLKLTKISTGRLPCTKNLMPSFRMGLGPLLAPRPHMNIAGCKWVLILN